MNNKDYYVYYSCIVNGTIVNKRMIISAEDSLDADMRVRRMGIEGLSIQRIVRV